MVLMVVGDGCREASRREGEIDTIGVVTHTTVRPGVFVTLLRRI